MTRRAELGRTTGRTPASLCQRLAPRPGHAMEERLSIRRILPDPVAFVGIEIRQAVAFQRASHARLIEDRLFLGGLNCIFFDGWKQRAREPISRASAASQFARAANSLYPCNGQSRFPRRIGKPK